MSFYTYMHTRNDTNEVFYIGKGKDKRAFWKYARNNHWKNIVQKHGYTVSILANWEDEKKAFEHEKFLIKCFKDMGAKLVNLTDGGDGPSGQKFSDSQRKTRSLLLKQKYENGYQNPKAMQGKKHSEETKAQMRLAHSKRNCKMSEEARQKISESSKGKPPTFGHKGKKHTDAAKLQISIAKKGVPWTEARRAAQEKRAAQRSK